LLRSAGHPVPRTPSSSFSSQLLKDACFGGEIDELKEINLASKKISDLGDIASLRTTLEQLNLAFNNIVSLKGIEQVSL